MVQVKVGAVWTHVDTEDEGILRVIYQHFSVKVDGYWFDERYKAGVWDGKKHFFNKRWKKFPTGLLDEFLKCAKEEDIEHTLIGNPSHKKNSIEAITKLGTFDLDKYPYDHQGASVRKILNYYRGVLEIATNGGKSAIAASLIASLEIPFLYIVATKESMYQARDVFCELLGVPTTWIGLLGDGKNTLNRSTIAIVNSAHTLAKKKPHLFRNFDLLMFNECHHATSNSWYELGMSIPARYRVGLSGTAFEGVDDKDWMLRAVTGPLLKKVTNDELIKRGISAKPKIVFLKSQVKMPVKGSYLEVVRDGIVNEEIRNCQIHALTFNLVMEGKNVLILTPREKHGSNITELLMADSKLDDVVYYNNGKMDSTTRRANLEKFKTNGGVMVATSIYDEDIDIPQVNVLIMALGMKKERKVLQRCGRALRKKQGVNTVTIYDFWDWHNKYLQKHSRERLKTYIAEGFEIVADKAASSWLEKTRYNIEHKEDKKPSIQDRKKPKRVRGGTVSKSLLRYRRKKV